MAAFPPKPQRCAEQQRAVEQLLTLTRADAEQLLAEHIVAAYAELTDGFRRQLRIEELVVAAAQTWPGLLPDRAEVQADRRALLRDQDGLEIDQGIFLAHALANPDTGHHLLHSMSQPRREARQLLARLRRDDHVDLGPVSVSVHRRGNLGYVHLQNHHCLNAENDESTAAMETAVDLVLLDERIEVGVLRAAVATHPKWAGRRVFGAGINLTCLYHGKISLVDFFLTRELGLVNKLYRGHAAGPADLAGAEERHEKPWIAVVEAFAIGGACQFLLVMDRVIAEPDAYVNLPALREGLIPGCANLRLPRFLGERLARQVIFFGRDIDAGSDHGRLLVDEIATPERIEETIVRSAGELTRAGTSSLRTNRKALRAGVEPVDTFRRYMAGYARDQGYNMHSPALIENLERNWRARSG